MQKVSTAYKESMKSPLRGRGFIMISFGLINQEAQANASVGDGEFAYFSRSDDIFSDKTEETVYATLEENFTKVDGSMFFLPRESADVYYDTGIIGDTLVSQAQYELTINLNIPAIDFRGLTINFGENYPVDFDITCDDGHTVEIKGNTEAMFTTEEVFEGVTYMKLTFYRMKNQQSRLRIYSIRFGYGLVYRNDSVISSSLDSYISPIGEDLPQIDFSVQLENYDHYFDVDNPKSAINFLETGQEMQIYYGYQLPDGEIEWIKGNQLLCSEWEADDYTATIRCQDVFRNLETEYYKGTYNGAGKSYFTLATEILQEAGISNYYIDPHLKVLYSKNPIPRVSYKEALQIISNACRCVLSQDRDGVIRIKSSFVPEVAAASNGETAYSDVENMLNNSVKNEYASFAANYTVANGGMYFLPRGSGTYLNTGYVSAEQSDENGLFDTNPVVTVTQEAACMYYGVKMIFGYTLPSGITIHTYNNGELVTEYEVEEEITQTLIIHHAFDDFDTMKIEFTKTAEPYNRIVLNYFAFGDITDFTMTRTDMTSSPKAIKQELIKDVVVPCYSYQKSGASEESLISEEITVSGGETMTFFLEDPSYGFRVTFNSSSDHVSIVEQGTYYVAVKFAVSGTYQFELFGYKYSIIEQYASVVLNDRGKTIKWENPLISDMAMAADLAEWLGEYYSTDVVYEYNTRGNPELDVNDVIYQENTFIDNMKVTVYQYTLGFNQSFSGKVTARRVQGGVSDGVANP